MPDDPPTLSANRSQKSDETITRQRAPNLRRRLDYQLEQIIATSSALVEESRRLLKLPFRKG